MTDTEVKIKQQAEWLKAHTLTRDQVKILFDNKLKRAAEMQSALKKREALCGGRQNRKRVIGNATLLARKITAINVGGLPDDKFLAITGMCKKVAY